MSGGDWTPTTDQLREMRDELAEQFPHLTVSVERRDDDTIHVRALPTG